MRALFVVTAAIAVGVMLFGAHAALAGEETKEEAGTPSETEGTAKWAPAVEPKPLSDNVKAGLMWLVEQQHQDGGWSQGEESAGMGRSMDKIKDIPNVGDTCMAALALIRSGSTPSDGDYARNIVAAVEYVCREVKESEDGTLYVTKTRGTRLQMKLGTYIDTFLASMLLAEVRGNMPDEKGEAMVLAGLDKVMDKIEKNQRDDGTFGGSGWANALSQSMAAKGFNRMAQVGVKVDEKVRERFETNGRSNFDSVSGSFSTKGSAGVDLYSSAANLGAMQDSANTNTELRAKLEDKVANGGTKDEREKARVTLARFDDNQKDLDAAQDAIVEKLNDKRFIAGFGSNGGEEFLSYMNIGESLVVKGGENWEKWDKEITANLNRIQNKDGSWTGHHCITGRTFCTSAALLVLMTDRAPVPIAAKVKSN